MAEALTTDSFPGEYSRPPVYGRPPLGMVRLVAAVAQGKTQAEAITIGAGERQNG